MDVCVVFVVRTKGFKQYKNGSKRKNPGQAKKKNPAGCMDVCLL
jgi:hypothetical protein